MKSSRTKSKPADSSASSSLVSKRPKLTEATFEEEDPLVVPQIEAPLTDSAPVSPLPHPTESPQDPCSPILDLANQAAALPNEASYSPVSPPPGTSHLYEEVTSASSSSSKYGGAFDSDLYSLTIPTPSSIVSAPSLLGRTLVLSNRSAGSVIMSRFGCQSIHWKDIKSLNVDFNYKVTLSDEKGSANAHVFWNIAELSNGVRQVFNHQPVPGLQFGIGPVVLQNWMGPPHGTMNHSDLKIKPKNNKDLKFQGRVDPNSMFDIDSDGNNDNDKALEFLSAKVDAKVRAYCENVHASKYTFAWNDKTIRQPLNSSSMDNYLASCQRQLYFENRAFRGVSVAASSKEYDGYMIWLKHSLGKLPEADKTALVESNKLEELEDRFGPRNHLFKRMIQQEVQVHRDEIGFYRLPTVDESSTNGDRLIELDYAGACSIRSGHVVYLTVMPSDVTGSLDGSEKHLRYQLKNLVYMGELHQFQNLSPPNLGTFLNAVRVPEFKTKEEVYKQGTNKDVEDARRKQIDMLKSGGSAF